MESTPTGPGRSDDVSGDTQGGRNTDLGSGPGHGRDGDEPHRAFGSATPGAGNPFSADEANADADATGPSEGTPEDVRIGGERAGLDEETGADAGDQGRETAP